MGKYSRLGNDLYSGHTSIDFVGRRYLWYALSGVIIVAAVLGLSFRGLNFGIEFVGGAEYTVTMPGGQATQANADKLRAAVSDTGIAAARQVVVTTAGTSSILVETEPLTSQETNTISTTIEQTVGVSKSALSIDEIGPSWGKEVAKRSITGLVVFLILVVLFIWAYFRQWKMSFAAIVALIHDLVITVGIYALSGFEVTPATVTGVLTILGFSLYDTVVVFDKVRENTKNLTRTRQTYAEAANLAVNQTLVRSINTSIVALLPVGALLYVGVVSLGSGALKDLALALFVGMAAGAYSSIFIATPLVVQLKEREAGVRAGDARAMKHRTRKDADRYATVPVYTDDLPVEADPGVDAEPVRNAASENGVAPRPVRAPRYTAGERPASRPVSQSAAAKRAQPSRKPRSQRGKK
jgi:preprotein translocase subunit SecF